METANQSLLNNLMVFWKHFLYCTIPGLFSKSMSSVLGNKAIRKTSEHQMHKEQSAKKPQNTLK